MGTTPDLGIPELAQSQANPDITHNEALVVIQALLNGVISRTLHTPPVSPTEGDSYIIAHGSPAASGAWAGRADSVAIFWGGSWRFVPGNDDSGTPITMGARQVGLKVWCRAESATLAWLGTGSPVAYGWTAGTITSGDISDFTEAAQDATGAMLANSARVTLTYADATPSLTADLVANSVGVSYMHSSATARLFGRTTAGDGAGEEISLGAGMSFSGGSLLTSALIYGGTLTGTSLTPVVIQTNEDGAAVSVFSLYRHSLTPAASDVLFSVRIQGDDSAGNKTDYGSMSVSILSPTDTAENGRVALNSVLAGTFASRVYVAAGMFGPGTTGGDKGVNTLNFSTIYQSNVQVLDKTANTVALSYLVNATGAKLIGATAAGAWGEVALDAASLEFSGSNIRRAALTGDVTATAGSNATTIANNVVTVGKMAQLAALSVLGNGTNATANVAAITAGTDGHVMRRSGTAVAFGTLAAGAFAAATVPVSALNVATDVATLLGSANNAAILSNIGAVNVAGDTMTGALNVNVVGGGVSTLVMSGESTGGITSRRYSTDANNTQLNLSKARGTIAAPTVVATSDVIFSSVAQAYSGSAFVSVERKQVFIRAATPSTTDLESETVLQSCAAGSASLTDLIRYRHSTGLMMYGTNVVVDNNRVIRARVFTVGTLPSATSIAGARAHVSDALTPAFGVAVAAGGAVSTPVYSDGTTWKVG